MEKYKPNKEEMTNTENIMTPDQKKSSESREKEIEQKERIAKRISKRISESSPEELERRKKECSQHFFLSRKIYSQAHYFGGVF